MDDALVRVSDAEREQAVSSLRDHLLAGRLTLDEFSDRVESALSARVRGDLARVHHDLPAAATEAALSRRRPARVSAALLGHIVRRGRLRLRRWTVAASAFGDLDLDLREATIDLPRTGITVLATCGNVDIYVPDGVSVDVRGIALLGHCREWGRDAAPPGAPAVHVRVLGCAGTVDVWRVPHDMRGSSYDDITRRLERRPSQPPVAP
jgi:DUF1707 SHOCT-like domain/Cell wall-active antibiotics response LiaF, C-terminal